MIDEKLIIETFHKNYFDLGWYRFMNRNKWYLSWLMAFFVVACVAALMTPIKSPMIYSGAVFVASIFLGAADHILIGVSINRTLTELHANGVEIDQATLLHIVSDSAPK